MAPWALWRTGAGAPTGGLTSKKPFRPWKWPAHSISLAMGSGRESLRQLCGLTMCASTSCSLRAPAGPLQETGCQGRRRGPRGVGPCPPRG